MKTVSRILATLVAGALVAGCEPPMDRIIPDLEPPYIVRVTPSGNAVAADATFEIKFSEPIQHRTIFWHDEDLGEAVPDGIVLGLSDDEDYLKSAVDNPPLSVTQRKKTLPVEVVLSASRDTVTVRPMQPLEGLTNYTLLVTRKIKDDRSNSLIKAPGEKKNATQLFSFTTAPSPDRTPPVATLKNPVPETTGVPIELGQVEVGFSEEIDAPTLTAATIGLRVRGTQDELVTAAVTLEGLVATFTLGDHPDGDCEKLCPDTEYELRVSSSVTDLAGNPVSTANLSTQYFKSATCTDDHPPRIANEATPEVDPGDVSVKVTWRTDEASTSVVELVEGDEAKLVTECSASPTEACVIVTGASSACQADVCELSDNPAEWQCQHSVVVSGLKPDTRYTLRVLSADAKGQQVYSNAVDFDTLEPLPKIVLNELFVSPSAPLTTTSEFIELFNAGDLDVDLAGWKIVRCDDNDCTTYTNESPLAPWDETDPTVLPAGAYAVVVGNSFPWYSASDVDGALVFRGLKSLRDGNVDGYVLLNQDGVPASSYRGHLGKANSTANKAKSFERKVATEADEAGNWAVSTAEFGTPAGNFATPGRRNSATP